MSTWDEWDAWCDGRIERMLREDFVPANDKMFEEFVVPAIKQYVTNETAKLYDQIVDLKVQVAALELEVKTLRSVNVVPIGKNKCRLILPNG